MALAVILWLQGFPDQGHGHGTADSRERAGATSRDLVMLRADERGASDCASDRRSECGGSLRVDAARSVVEAHNADVASRRQVLGRYVDPLHRSHMIRFVWDPIAGVLGPVVVSDDLRAAVAPTVAHTRNHFAAEHPVTAGPEFLRSRCEIASETLLRPSDQTGAHSVASWACVTVCSGPTRSRGSRPRGTELAATAAGRL